MKKTGWGWGLGLATAGMVFTASHVLAGTGAGGGAMGEKSEPSTGSSTMGETSSHRASALQGKVESLDRSKNTLTLSGSDKILKVDASTLVMKNGEKATLDDVKEGDEVRASYSGTGTTVKARTLEVGEPAGKMGK